jgi:hypothetical protein
MSFVNERMYILNSSRANKSRMHSAASRKAPHKAARRPAQPSERLMRTSNVRGGTGLRPETSAVVAVVLAAPPASRHYRCLALASHRLDPEVRA